MKKKLIYIVIIVILLLLIILLFCSGDNNKISNNATVYNFLTNNSWYKVVKDCSALGNSNKPIVHDYIIIGKSLIKFCSSKNDGVCNEYSFKINDHFLEVYDLKTNEKYTFVFELINEEEFKLTYNGFDYTSVNNYMMISG